jgi:hypothetical protein
MAGSKAAPIRDARASRAVTESLSGKTSRTGSEAEAQHRSILANAAMAMLRTLPGTAPGLPL